MDNEFIMHFKEMLRTHFPPIFGYKVKYIIGEDKKGNRGLYFELRSNKFGLLYAHFEKLDSHMIVSDIETDFMNNVINDFILGGITLMNIESHNQKQNEMVNHDIMNKSFKNSLPKKLLFIN